MDASKFNGPLFQIAREVEKTDFLPPYFAIAQKTLKLIGTPEVNFREIASVLETDQALVSRLLSLVNSVYYGLSREIIKMDEALSYLGLRETRNAVMAVSTREILSSGPNRATWLHSLTTAYLSEALAKHSGQGTDPSDAFTAGLLHDIGKMFLEKKLPEANRMIQAYISLGSEWLDAEVQVLGMNHASVGDLVLARWKVPPVIRNSVKYHHAPWEGPDPLCKVVALANQVASLAGGETAIDEALLQFCCIERGDLEGLWMAVQISIADFENRLSGALG